MRKIREMMESCSHTEYRQSFYLTLHSEGLLFHGPPYLILLLPPRLPLLLVHKPLPENLAVEKRRRVKTEASGYRESLRGTGIRSSPSRLSVPPCLGRAEPLPAACCQWSLPAQIPLAQEEWGSWPWHAVEPRRTGWRQSLQRLARVSILPRERGQPAPPTTREFSSGLICK